ncbi:hypothetical protein [Fictibacillus terranigra]|uniref:Uncharacterized protein n=1 Tax=Fictibacillus terranigra TaxID=3058424 RepID=A0ABT8EBX2_9BACL|nr:hypothetical protein [Fictibacillus sp. CENA-BCM004]MDN4075372.1 hypothetical protein [Fictibacillus sp. CENA-BCM004]
MTQQKPNNSTARTKGRQDRNQGGMGGHSGASEKEVQSQKKQTDINKINN